MVQQAAIPVDDCVREVTDEEVAALHRDGWVQMKGLVSRDLVDELLSQAKHHLEASRDRPGPIPGVWNFAFIARDQRVEPFVGLVLSEKMGKNARRLINRQRLTDRSIPIRYRYDGLLCKEPGGGPSADDGHADGSTPYHQDIPDHGPDRVGELNIWLALAPVTPEMGSMRFLTGAHREGGLGAGVSLGGVPDVLGQYPKLLDFYEPLLRFLTIREMQPSIAGTWFMEHRRTRATKLAGRTSCLTFLPTFGSPHRPILSTPHGAARGWRRRPTVLRPSDPAIHSRLPRRTIWMPSTRSSALEHRSNVAQPFLVN